MNAAEVINMSNIDYVYTADPKKDPTAEKIEATTWSGFKKLVGDTWDPGMNIPFDPVASREAEAIGLRVIIIGNETANRPAGKFRNLFLIVTFYNLLARLRILYTIFLP